MTAQWPIIKAGIADLMPTLSGWDTVTVFPGKPSTSDAPSAYATVGFVVDDESAGSYSITRDPDGFQWQETGRILGTIVCQTGEVDDAGMETEAFTLMDSLEQFVRANLTLGGLLSQEGTCDIAAEVMPISNVNGTAVTLIFTLSYFTVT